MHAGRNDMPINGDDRQTIHPRLHFFKYGRIDGEGLRLLPEIVALHRDALLGHPVEVGGKSHQRRINGWPANAGRAHMAGS